ncbi:uncharacterized protein TRUGW13939_12007 [Talaromyces rugulosus]|uniref:F-box domain-containing protein n=1 Tax=Talaromyces rugulosus TaxID=121627 RepID=A0A7H8RGD9_TALRU|nr:uncharacterized protein TRUGW13939_12007 [Talaromyces rugulosus]QKX64831.1 hypothetical protein TRUGW13939_12007 [Talaromyces rugulosus]
MATLMNMSIEIWLMIMDSMGSKYLARLSQTCKDAQAIAEERLYRQCNFKWLISWTLQTQIRVSTLEKLLRYRKEPGGRECLINDIVDGIPALMDAALRENDYAVDLLLENDFVVTKETIVTLLCEGRQFLIIETFAIGAQKGYDMLLKMMADCIPDQEDTKVKHPDYWYGHFLIEMISQAASLDRPEITKPLLSILPRSERQILLKLALTFGMKTKSLDCDQKEKAVRSLLAHGADPCSGHYEEPLEIAARAGYDKIVSMLLQTRKFNWRSESHRRAWRIAKNRGHHTVMKALLPERRVSERLLSRSG